jgi:predicted outer membrane repeat protein
MPKPTLASIVVRTVLFALTCLGGGAAVLASTFTVTNTNASGAGSLLDAITQANAAAGPHNINITASGTVTVATPFVLTQSMTIKGPDVACILLPGTVCPGPAFTIDGGNTSRLIQVATTATGPMTLSALTLTHGRTDSVKGGAVDVPTGQTLNINDCLVTANATTGTSSGDPLLAAGGAVSTRGTLNILRSTFSNNTATGPGGAIYAAPSATLSIAGSLFTGNQVPDAWAGAIYCDSSTLVTITDSTFTLNRSGSGGSGAAGFWNTKAVIRGSTFTGNSTLGAGGAFVAYAAPGETIGVENSTLSGNRADYGGAIYAQLGTTDLRNVTITANVARRSSGFDNAGGATVLMRNTIVAGNVGTQSISDCSGPVTSSGYNLIGSASGCTGFTGTDVTGVTSPLSGLADNGGPTQTHLLYAGSPAIDGGNPAGCIGLSGATLTVDQRGRIRPFGARCDIGAVEMETTTPAQPKRHLVSRP